MHLSESLSNDIAGYINRNKIRQNPLCSDDSKVSIVFIPGGGKNVIVFYAKTKKYHHNQYKYRHNKCHHNQNSLTPFSSHFTGTKDQEFSDMIAKEKKHVTKELLSDSKKKKNLPDQSPEGILRMELKEAFDYISLMLPLPFPLIINQPEPKYDEIGEIIRGVSEISCLGLEVLLKRGDLISVKNKIVLEAFKSMDVRGRGCVTFEEVGDTCHRYKYIKYDLTTI